MEYSKFKELLDLYHKQRYNEADLKMLWEMLSDKENEEKVKGFLTKELDDFNSGEYENRQADFEKIFKNIQSKISEKKQSHSYKSNRFNSRIAVPAQILRVAAILVVGLFVGSVLTYMVFKKPAHTVETYTSVKAPYGARSIVSLPDGSTVWINAGSSIKYKNSFNKDTRTVQLDGEAYFKVAKNKDIPFIVNTGGIDIIAVGTEFNVKAYTDEEFIEATLVEGKITIRGDKDHTNKDIKQVSLEPQQKAVFMRDNQQIKVATIKAENNFEVKAARRMVYIAKKIDPEPVIAWKDNKLIIRSEEMGSLAVKLERKYNVSISFAASDIKKYKFTGTLEDETLPQVLDVIKLSAPIDYKLEGKEVKIFENKSMAQKFSDHLKRK